MHSIRENYSVQTVSTASVRVATYFCGSFDFAWQCLPAQPALTFRLVARVSASHGCGVR